MWDSGWINDLNVKGNTTKLIEEFIDYSYYLGLEEEFAMGWMSVSPQNSLCWSLIPKVMIFACGFFGRWLGHENETLMNGIIALIKENPESSSSVSTVWGYKRKSAVWLWKRALSRTWSQTSSLQNCKKYISVVYKPRGLWYFVIAVQTD